MITCRLPVLLAERRMTRTALAQKAKLSINTLRPLYNDSWQRIDRNTIDSICRVLGVQVGELFEYVETKAKKAGK
jgi:putative transcriptional regulator